MLCIYICVCVCYIIIYMQTNLILVLNLVEEYLWQFISFINLIWRSVTFVKYSSRQQSHFFFKCSIGKYPFENFLSLLQERRFLWKILLSDLTNTIFCLFHSFPFFSISFLIMHYVISYITKRKEKKKSVLIFL